MYNPSKIIGLKRIETNGNAVLWEIQIPTRTFRYIWIFAGWFPSYVFEKNYIRDSLAKSYMQAAKDRAQANERARMQRLENEQSRLDRELDKHNTPTVEVPE